MKKSVASRLREVILPLCSDEPYLEYQVQLWTPVSSSRKTENNCRESSGGLERRLGAGGPYEERLRNLGLISLEKRRLKGDLYQCL